MDPFNLGRSEFFIYRKISKRTTNPKTFISIYSHRRYTRKLRRNVKRFSGVFGIYMGEYCLGHIIARERSFFQFKKQQEQHQWIKISYRPLSSLVSYHFLYDLKSDSVQVLGILGLGDIGADIARLAAAFGMTVWGLKR